MKAYSIDLRERVVKAQLQGQTQEEVAQRFGVGSSSVGRYVQQYREEGTLEPKPRPGRARLLAGEDLEALRAQVLNDRSLSQQQHAQKFFEERGIRLSRATIGRYLQRLGLSRKK